MTSLNENIDPHSLPNLSNLLSNSARKRNNNKHKVHKGFLGSSGLRDSVLHNLATEHRNEPVEHSDAHLSIPLNSQSMETSHDKLLIDETRLPISPPPEEEIRIKELSAHGQTPNPKSRLPVPSRANFKFPAPPQSFANYQLQARQISIGGPDPTPLATHAATAPNANPRKRMRSGIPPVIPTTSSTSVTSINPVATSTVATQSPNPKPRKQPKVRESGVYSGSGFKRRHNRGTSLESLDISDEQGPAPAPTLSLKSPARKKRTHDHGAENYTPQRERPSPGTPKKPKPRARRSATVDVRYEPPAEQFTPPRNVVLPLPSSTTSTRSRSNKPSSAHSVDRKVVKVKPERLTSPFPPPALDLRPAPPPSPTDDPILLVGPPVLVRRSPTPSIRPKSLVDAAVGVNDDDVAKLIKEPSTPIRASRPLGRPDVDETRWNMAPDAVEETALMDLEFDGPSHFDATFDPDSDSDAGDGAASFNEPLTAAGVFDPDLSTGSHIFHSDDEDADAGEDEGEYTGRFKFYSVPVKQDPPSSATRARRDSWGRPISPFPFRRRLSGSLPHEDGEGQGEAKFHDESPPPSPSEGRKRLGTPKQAAWDASLANSTEQEQEPRRRGFTLSEMEARLEARKAERNGADLQTKQGDDAEGDGQQDVTVRLEEHEASDVDEDCDDAEEEAEEVEVASVEREVTPTNEAGVDDDNGETAISENDGEDPLPRDAAMFNEHEELDSESEVDAPSRVQFEHINPSAEEKSPNKQQSEGQRIQEPASAGLLVPALTSDSPLATSVSSLKPRQFTEHYIALNTEDDGLAPVNAYDDGDDESSDEEVAPSGIVEVSSDDPKAAARVAAILKLHHSYILDGVVAKHKRRRSSQAFPRRSSFASGDEDAQGRHDQDMIRRAWRKSIAGSGGVLQHRPRQTSHSPLVRSVFTAPGSPAGSIMSAKDVLREAEMEIRAASASPCGPRTPLKPTSFPTESLQSQTDSPSPTVLPEGLRSQVTHETEWTKADWKMLDTCFTDERLAVGEAMGLGTRMAEVDDVEFENVMARFLARTQGDKEWDHDKLIRRVIALSHRQRKGDGAPPSPNRSASGPSNSGLAVPVFTSPAPQRIFVPPSEVGLTQTLPPSLLAPRYAHLHEEAAKINPEQPSPSSTSPVLGMPELEAPVQQDEAPGATQSPTQTPTSQHPRVFVQPSRNSGAATAPTAPASATKRVLGYIGSFLGRGGAAATTKSALKPVLGALPLLPPEMRQAVRGPINTPAKKPLPKIQAPRELVHLTETQLPTKPCAIPRPQSAREMVSLHHIDPPRSVQRPRTASGPIAIPGRTRKDSGGSVKDLVRSFEEVQRRTEEEMTRLKGKTAMRKVASVGNLKARGPWKP